MDKTPEQIIEILKSGDFTIIYWDSGEASLYQKKWDKEEEFERDGYVTMDKFKVEFVDWPSGYCPTIVEYLVVALGGKYDSI